MNRASVIVRRWFMSYSYISLPVQKACRIYSGWTDTGIQAQQPCRQLRILYW